jgi:hypothetical protein
LGHGLNHFKWAPLVCPISFHAYLVQKNFWTVPSTSPDVMRNGVLQFKPWGTIWKKMFFAGDNLGKKFYSGGALFGKYNFAFFI